MTKQKFELTTDLVKIEPEPEPKENKKNFIGKVPSQEIDRVTINMNKKLKLELQLYSINNKTNMTDVIQALLMEKLGLKDLDW